MSPLPINNDILRGWVTWETPFGVDDAEVLVVSGDDETKPYIGVYGYGPFSAAEFCAFLEDLDFYVDDMETEDTFDGLTLIIGENGWDSDLLKDYLHRAIRRAKELEYPVRIYSQEMFMFRVMSGIDPFDTPIEVLKTFGRGHSALDYLANLGFDRPASRFFPDSEPGSGENRWPETSPLAAMGYRVGIRGIDVSRRHAILKRAFHGQLPNVVSVSYMDKWGEPYTAARLEKIASSIAAYIGLAKRRNSGMELAIACWEADLEWRRRKFYTGRFEFQWPSY